MSSHPWAMKTVLQGQVERADNHFQKRKCDSRSKQASTCLDRKPGWTMSADLNVQLQHSSVWHFRAALLPPAGTVVKIHLFPKR